MIFYGIKYTTNLIAGQDVEEISIFVIIFRILLILFALYIVKRTLIYMNKNNKKRKKYKRKK